jgi:flagellar basal-body rod protein FlgF/flagellar basal-body rod protein FlgG
MDSGYYAAVTGLVTRSQELDLAATNLANANTSGYRAEQEYFRSVLLGPDGEDSQLGETVNNYGVLGGQRLSMAQGELERTGNPLDLAILSQGFFQVQTPNGLRYTRNGGFHRSPLGLLVTEAGEPVQSTTGQPILLPPGEVTVGADGVISVAGGTVATVGVFTFPDGTQLTPEGSNLYAAAENTPVAVSKAATVYQGGLESANQSAVKGAMRLTMIQREAEMMQRALTIFHTEFNKFATEDLPKV